MPTIRDQIASLRTAAIEAGIVLPMAKLSDALALCLFNRPYSAVIAAEQAGTPPVADPSRARTVEVASRYRIAADCLAKIVLPVTVAESVPLERDEAPAIRVIDPGWDEIVPLYCKYDRQNQAQRAFLEIDPESEPPTLSAGYSGEIGNAIPFAVWHNRLLRYRLPSAISGSALRELMAADGEVMALARRIVDGYEVHWDGSNHKGRLDRDATDASERLDEMLRNLDETAVCGYVTSACDWLDRDDLDSVWPAGKTIREAETGIEENAAQERVYIDDDVELVLAHMAREALEDDPEGCHAQILDWGLADGCVTIQIDDLETFEEMLETLLPLDNPDYIDDEAIGRGINAAKASLASAGVTPGTAWAAVIKADSGDEHDAAAAAAWRAAELAAARATLPASVPVDRIQRVKLIIRSPE